MTLDRARVRLGQCDSCAALAYVALSRVRTKEGLLIDSQFFDAKRLTGVKLKDYVAQFDRDSEVLLRNTNRMLDLEENGNVQVESEEEDDGNDGNQMFEDEEEFDDNDQEFETEREDEGEDEIYEDEYEPEYEMEYE